MEHSEQTNERHSGADKDPREKIYRNLKRRRSIFGRRFDRQDDDSPQETLRERIWDKIVAWGEHEYFDKDHEAVEQKIAQQKRDRETLKNLDDRTRTEFYMIVAERFRSAGDRLMGVIRSAEQQQDGAVREQREMARRDVDEALSGDTDIAIDSEKDIATARADDGEGHDLDGSKLTNEVAQVDAADTAREFDHSQNEQRIESDIEPVAYEQVDPAVAVERASAKANKRLRALSVASLAVNVLQHRKIKKLERYSKKKFDTISKKLHDSEKARKQAVHEGFDNKTAQTGGGVSVTAKAEQTVRPNSSTEPVVEALLNDKNKQTATKQHVVFEQMNTQVEVSEGKHPAIKDSIHGSETATFSLPSEHAFVANSSRVQEKQSLTLETAQASKPLLNEAVISSDMKERALVQKQEEQEKVQHTQRNKESLSEQADKREVRELRRDQIRVNKKRIKSGAGSVAASAALLSKEVAQKAQTMPESINKQLQRPVPSNVAHPWQAALVLIALVLVVLAVQLAY